MKRAVQLFGLCLSAVVATLTSVRARDQAVVVTDPFNLPPTNGAGWYSISNESVSFYVEYGTNQGLPSNNTFTGILVRAHSMIVDNFRNVTNWYDGNDQVIRFDANLTANVVELSGLHPDPDWVITLGGNMQVRLAGRLGHATGTFPLTVEALSFTLYLSDLGTTGTNAILGIRTMASPISGGELSVSSVGGGVYQVASTLNVHSESAAYRTDRWLPYWPDTNAPTGYSLLSLQPPPAVIALYTNGSVPAVAGQFQLRKNVCYRFDHSADLRNWVAMQTNYLAGCGLGDAFKFVEALTNSAGFYRAEATLVPMP